MSSSARSLGLGSLLALGVNGIVGVGIFFTPNLVAAVIPGRAGIWAYLLTLLALLPVALTYARLGARFDRDGGPYVWASAAFGESFAFVIGFVAYASAVLSSAAVIAGLGEYTAPLLGLGGAKRAFSVACALIFAGITLSGLKPSAWVWSTLTVLKILPLFALIFGFLFGGRTVAALSGTESGSWARAVLLVMFSMQGFEIVPVPASHARSPERTVPLATVGSLVLCAGLYALLHAACVAALPDLAKQEAPLVAAASVLGGVGLAAIVSAGTNVSSVGIAFGEIAMTPRYLAALEARGENAALHELETRAVPRRALAVTLVLVVILVSVGALGRLFVLSSVAVLFQYSISVVALVVLALRRKNGLIPRDALVAPFALVALGLVASAVERAELAVMAGIVVLALLLGFARSRVRIAR